MGGMGPGVPPNVVKSSGSSIPDQVAVASDADGNIKFALVTLDPGTGKISNISITEQTGTRYVKIGTETVATTTGTSGGSPGGRFGVPALGLFRLRLRTGGPLGGITVIEATTTQIDLLKKLFLGEVKSGVDQAGAGAAANEVWKTSGHATLPDNVLMIGV